MNMTKKEIILLMNNDGNQPDCFFKIHNLQSCGTFLTKPRLLSKVLWLLSKAETTEFEPHGC